MEPIDDLDRRIYDQWDACVTRSARLPSRTRKWVLACLAGGTALALGTGVIVLRADGAEAPSADAAVIVTTTEPRVVVVPTTLAAARAPVTTTTVAPPPSRVPPPPPPPGPPPTPPRR